MTNTHHTMHPLERFFKNGKVFYRTKKPIILKDLKKYTSFPGMEEKDLLLKKQFIEAVLMASLRIEQNLKWLYFYRSCKQTWGMYYEIFEFTFYKIANMARAGEIIDKEEYRIINKLRIARNEIAHNPHASNNTIDEKKCKKIVEPCFRIINNTHNQLMKIQEEKKNKMVTSRVQPAIS